jgi:hypothetical protein
MATKFFTNLKGNTLLQKLEGIFQHMQVYHFDALVGYFRMSGYHLIHEFLDRVEEVRILVGIDVDSLVWKAYQDGLEFLQDKETTKEKLLDNMVSDVQSAVYSYPVEKGMLHFMEGVRSGKIRIKAHPSRKLHAKIYIFRQQHEHEPKPLPDRKALDDLIFDALDLTREERKEAYWATAELVKQRLDKAASHKERKKTRGARPSFAPPQEDEDIVKLKELIAKGENKQVEFKQSLRPGPGTTSRFAGVKHNILKSIAAFLNTEGGTLLIGVAPGNTIAGLEAHDYTTFSEADKEDAWRKHFDNTIQAHFGDHLQALVDLDIVKAEGKSVAIVRIKGRAPEPVWLKNRDENNREEFYIRRSASTVRLEGSEPTAYINQLWRKKA